MKLYEPSIEADLLLLNWYMDLGSGPDFEAAFAAEMAPCGVFMAAMQQMLLVYEADERGIWGAMWFARQMSAGFASLWVREDKRHWNTGVQFLGNAMEFGLERFPVLVFASKNPKVIYKAATYGFVVLGEIPWIFDGDTATVGWVDSARFEAARHLWQRPADAPQPNGAEHG